MLLCKPLVRKSPSGWRLIASVFHFVLTVQTPSLARRRSQFECARASLPRACDVAAGLRCFGNFLDPRRAATPAGVVVLAKLTEAPTNSGRPPRLARLSGSIPFCLSILSYTLGFILSARMKGFCGGACPSRSFQCRSNFSSQSTTAVAKWLKTMLLVIGSTSAVTASWTRDRGEAQPLRILALLRSDCSL